LVNRGKLIGLLYLENNLTSHVFTPGRVTVLEVLASQAAISLENARLYAEHEQAEEFLRESEKRYERVILAAEAGFWDWDVAKDEFYVSPRLLEMAGFPAGTTFAGREDFMGRTPFYPEDRNKWLQAVRELFTSGGSRVAMDVRLVLDGETVWNRLDGMCFRDAAGRVVRWTGSATDITDRKQAEDALRESQERYAVAVEGAMDGIWDWDLVTGMFYRAPRNQQITMGRQSDGIDVRHADEWSRWFQLHPDDAPIREEAIRSHLEGRTPLYEVEYRVRHQDGTYHWVHARGVCTRDASGRPVRFAGSTSDIDARRAAEEALRESEERYSLAVAGSNEGIFDWDLVSDRVYVSTRAQELFGVSPREPWRPRKRWRNILNFHPDDRLRQHDAIKALIEGRRPLYDEEFRIIFPDASVRWFGQRGIALRDASGKAYRMVGSIGDITDRKMAQEELLRLERQLRQAQRLEAMGTLAGGIAHDFNNILGAIIGYGEMALRGAKKDTRLWRDLDAIMSAGERGRALVDRILAFSRSGTGERVPVHVEAVVQETLDQLAAKLPENVTIAPRLRAGRAALLGDSTQVHQVVMNLTNNAAQAMPNGGVLRVRLEAERVDVARAATLGAVASGDCIVLEVSDSGTGIAPEVLERMFDPFFTTKEVGVGSGLGLSLVHGIVTNVGGAIDVTTELGKGSTFTVYFPRCGDAPVQTAHDTPTLPRGEGQRVLVVEDEEALLRLATETLEELGYTPTGFTSSTAALAAFRADPQGFDAVLTDERMPGVTGSALIREVRRISSSIPIVLMSGFVGAAAALQARELGANDVLRKPLLARDLATSLAGVLHG
jgi:PAS domain S-box-containing protein